ncbi:MAG: formate dehydrogenase accessory protein FdhE [Desulfobacteraceae bacterium]
MVLKNDCTALDIKKACEILQEGTPHLIEVISLYGEIFALQQETMHTVNSASAALSEDLVQIKLEHGFPLLSRSDFIIDMDEAEKLSEQICEICRDLKINALESIEKIRSLITDKKTDFKSMVGNYLGDDPAWLDSFSKTHGLDRENLEFLVYNSIKPFIVKEANQVTAYLETSTGEHQGFCPVCGSGPAVSILSDNGSRSFACSFCWHEWPSERIFCPFCNTKDSKHLSYLYVEDKKGVRGDVCDNCRKYIKTIDTRELNRNIFLPLEIICTLPLDIKLREDGYTS